MNVLKRLLSIFQKKYIRRFPEVASILIFVFATIEMASLLSFSYQPHDANVLGLFGYASAIAWYFLFGSTSFFGTLYLYTLSWNWWHKKYHSNMAVHALSYVGTLLSLGLLVCLTSDLFPMLNHVWVDVVGKENAFPISGFLAHFLYHDMPYGNFHLLFSTAGTALIASTMLFVFVSFLFALDIKSLFKSLVWWRSSPKTKDPEIGKKKSFVESVPQKQPKMFAEKTTLFEKTRVVEGEKKFPALPLSGTGENGFVQYLLPSIELLNPPKKIDTADLQKELKDKAGLLEETLMSFGIEAKVGQIHYGPTVTMFEVQPAVGVKIGKIKTLENDIALNMEAKSIRIIAPIPGKAAIGIEVPNHTPQEVCFREVLSAYKEQKTHCKIPMLLGKAVNGELIITDLTKMPHCIIAGATGSGKSVCINSIIMSILMLARPEEIRLLMIDPKKVELTSYTALPHMLAPVITEPNEAAQALHWLVREMEKRYEILKCTGQRNIESFNKRRRNIDEESAFLFEIPEKFAYYVAIIDELADLMMISSQDIETPIARIAQMARAVGIHLILATQRPSREVITGVIKANFPARIAFKVASRINSQIILDDVGAEALLRYGDMLILLPGTSQLVRCQGVHVRDEEIVKVIEDISTKRPTQYLFQSFQKFDGSSAGAPTRGGGSYDTPQRDPLLSDAKEIVFSTGNASTTFLQRKFKIGYARAASIMDQLEEQGIVGPQDGSKPRMIFFPKKSGESQEEEEGEDTPHLTKNQERLLLLQDIASKIEDESAVE